MSRENLRRRGEGLLEELLTEVEQAERRQGVAFGGIQVVDNTHTLADAMWPMMTGGRGGRASPGTVVHAGEQRGSGVNASKAQRAKIASTSSARIFTTA